MSKYKKKIIRNTIFTFLEKIILLSFPFITFPLIVRVLSKEASGIWFFCSALVSYFTIFDKGPGPAITKYVAEHYFKGEKDEISEYLSSGISLYLIFGLVVFLVMFFFAFFGIKFVKMDLLYSQVFRNVFLLMGLVLAICFPLKVFPAALRGMQDFKPLSIINVIASFFKFIALIFVLKSGGGIYSLLCIQFIWLLMTLLIPARLVLRKEIKIKVSFNTFTSSYFNKIIKFGSITFLINLCAILIFQTDRLLIGSFIGISAVTGYTACKRLYDVCSYLPGFILQAIMPFASELNAKEEAEKQKKLFLLSTKYSYALFIPIGVFTIFFAKKIIIHWIGEDFVEFSLPLQILVFHLFFNYFHHAGSQILIGMNKIKFMIPYYISVLLSNIVFSLILVKYYNINGIASGTTIPFVIFEFYYVKKMLNILNIKFLTLVAELAQLILPFIIVLTYVFFLREKVDSLLTLLFFAATTLFIMLFAFMITIPQDERNIFLKIIRRNNEKIF